jgi:SNF2 family DNA or RNA helicase
MNINNQQTAISYAPINGFTTSDIGCERGNNIINPINKLFSPSSDNYLKMFDQIWNDKTVLEDVTAEVIDGITAAYNENSPEFIYFIALYNIFSEFLEDISQDVLPNEATGFKQTQIWNKLYDFQQDAALSIINKLEKFNGCILADSVGLGKTFSALAVIKYYELRNRMVLVLCPKKLSDNWNTFKSNYVNNPLTQDKFRYDVVYHTDLSRDYGLSNGLDLDKLNWKNYDLVVIDESHNFRNGGELHDDNKENRYLRLLNRVIKSGVKTKVLMLSATPVNNKFEDLQNQISLAYEGQDSLEEIFTCAKQAFRKWSELEQESRTTAELLHLLDFDFFELLDKVTIARSRKHIQKYYNMDKIGHFPHRLSPISCRPKLTDLPNAITYSEIYEQLNKLLLAIYTPMAYVHPSKLYKYIDTATNRGDVLRIEGLERGTSSLMTINLLKRLESSVYSFRLTMQRIKSLIDNTIQNIDDFENGKSGQIQATELSENDFDDDDQNMHSFAYGKKRKIDLADMDYVSWRKDLTKDSSLLEFLISEISDITPEHDLKLQELLNLISLKIKNPINPNNKKVLIFSAFSDTVEYLYNNVTPFIKKEFDLDSAMITGSIEGKTTIAKFRPSLNNVLTCFSPLSKDKHLLMPNSTDSIDILIATDCISEGQNLQDCDYCLNYDIHWNPVRIIQRFGRIDRIGSKNKDIQLVNFWPDIDLDEYIKLKARVETRMKISIMASTGDDDLINIEEKGDLQYRKNQLERLQKEVVDIEDMLSGISIMDLGLNEFRLDLLSYINNNGDLDKSPYGLHAIVPASNDISAGIIFVLKNINKQVNIDNQNRLHPFYMVYIASEGKIICNHLSPKDLLDTMRNLCKGKNAPDKNLCDTFNQETKDGKNMDKYSKLLGQAINSIIDLKSKKELDSFIDGKQVSFTQNKITGLDDFELICFLVVK